MNETVMLWTTIAIRNRQKATMSNENGNEHEIQNLAVLTMTLHGLSACADFALID